VVNERKICPIVTPAAQGLSMEDLRNLTDREGIVSATARDYEVIWLQVEYVLEDVGDSDSDIGRNSCLAGQVFEIKGAKTPWG
jgi:hypothetical protein